MTNREIGDPISGLAQLVEKHEHDIQNIYGKLMRAFVGSRIVAGSVTGVLPPGTVITPTIINMLNTSGGSLDDGDVVVLDITAARSVKTTTIRGDPLVIGVVRDVNNIGPFSNGSETPIQIDGFVATMNVTGSVAIGDFLRTSATVKLAESVGAAPTANVFARALSVAAAGSVNAYILAAGTGGSGGSGSSGIGPPGADGDAGDDGSPGPPGAPGPAGAAGATGANGPMGAMLWMEPDAPDEPMMIPGMQGPTGATGAAGTGVSVGMIFQNEVKGWPCLLEIGAGVDLVTLNQWWDDEATPTTKASAVPSSGEAGLDAKFLQVIKCVTDASNEGFLQRYTYADEPRVKSGAKLSALVWVATTGGGTGITAQLRNSDATNTSFTSIATDGDWSLLYVANHTCAGTYVELVITKDTSGTFYAGGPITVMVGADGVLLPPRHGVYRLNAAAQTEVENLSGQTTKANADLDLTAAATPLAYMAQMHVDMFEGTTGQFAYKVRPNGTSWTTGIADGPAFISFVLPNDNESDRQDWIVLLDDLQIVETELANSGGGTVDTALLYLVGWWEWE